MSANSFFDTNIFLYADDTRFPDKQKKAVDLIEEHWRNGSATISLQILQEYFHGATSKLSLPVEKAREKVELISAFRLAILRPPDLLSAIDIHRLHKISFWDALVVRAAQQTGCRVLFSEDMQQGRDFDGVRVVNPFQ